MRVFVLIKMIYLMLLEQETRKIYYFFLIAKIKKINDIKLKIAA